MAVNCGTVPKDLAESLLFGHLKGAFTGADQVQTGYSDLADGGALFPDEVGDMPYDLQIKLLRVLEDGHVMPLGARRLHSKRPSLLDRGAGPSVKEVRYQGAGKRAFQEAQAQARARDSYGDRVYAGLNCDRRASKSLV